MKKLSVKDLVEFRRKSDRAKKTFIENIKSNKIEAPTEGGGDYWISSLSAVCNSYKQDDLDLIDEKIDELQEKFNNTNYTITKNMYQRNMAILQKYKIMDLKNLRQSGKLSFLKKSTANRLLTIKGLQIEAKPSHVYVFGEEDDEKVAAIWFTAKVNGYRIEEVGMFCDLLYRFLKHNYSKKYQLSSRYCIAVDILSAQTVNYSQIEGGGHSQVLNRTLDDITNLL